MGLRRWHPLRRATARQSDDGGQRARQCPLGQRLPSYVAGVIKEDVAAFWAAQPFDLGMDSDYGNCDLCRKKNEAKLIRTIQEDSARVIWWSGTEKRFGQVFRQDRPDFGRWPGQRTSAQDRRTLTSITWLMTSIASAGIRLFSSSL